jgi:LPS export ABC transporter protein LptC
MCSRINLFILLIINGLFFSFSCKSEKKEIIAAVSDRTKTPMMHADSVSTVISDSGITRYRISALIWDIYDRMSEPYWEFPKGINLERFNSDLKTDANIKAGYAHFNQNKQLWELRKNVHATNVEGTLFVTEQMFWDQRNEKIYSDSLITITKPDGYLVVGHNGFEANQQLTKYTIKNSSGAVPVNE